MNELNTAPAPWPYESESGQLLNSRRMLPQLLDAQADQVQVDVAALGLRSDDACLALRLDFAGENRFAKAVTYTCGKEANLPAMPFEGAPQKSPLP